MDEIDAGRPLEQLKAEMRRGSDAIGRTGELARLGLCERDEFFQRLDRQRGPDHQHIRRQRDPRDGKKILVGSRLVGDIHGLIAIADVVISTV